MAPAHEDERRSPRSKVFLSAVLEWADQKLPVILRDLSEHGALIEMTGAISAESEVLFCRKDPRVRGHIAWIEGKTAGISFGRPLKSDVVLRPSTGRPPRVIDESVHRRPGLVTRGLSAEEQRRFDDMTREPHSKKRGR